MGLDHFKITFLMFIQFEFQILLYPDDVTSKELDTTNTYLKPFLVLLSYSQHVKKSSLHSLFYLLPFPNEN